MPTPLMRRWPRASGEADLPRRRAASRSSTSRTAADRAMLASVGCGTNSSHAGEKARPWHPISRPRFGEAADVWLAGPVVGLCPGTQAGYTKARSSSTCGRATATAGWRPSPPTRWRRWCRGVEAGVAWVVRQANAHARIWAEESPTRSGRGRLLQLTEQERAAVCRSLPVVVFLGSRGRDGAPMAQ